MSAEIKGSTSRQSTADDKSEINTPRLNGIEEDDWSIEIDAEPCGSRQMGLGVLTWSEEAYNAPSTRRNDLTTLKKIEAIPEQELNRSCYYDVVALEYDSMNQKGKGPDWMFDLEILSPSLNYIPVRKENQVDTTELNKKTAAKDFRVKQSTRFQVTPKDSTCMHEKDLSAISNITKIGLWYPKDSPFHLEAFSDSDYSCDNHYKKDQLLVDSMNLEGYSLLACKKQTICYLTHLLKQNM
ncbi:hypothetical protein Tco_1439051 [Tanacetum coccineum]